MKTVKATIDPQSVEAERFPRNAERGDSVVIESIREQLPALYRLFSALCEQRAGEIIINFTDLAKLRSPSLWVVAVECTPLGGNVITCTAQIDGPMVE